MSKTTTVGTRLRLFELRAEWETKHQRRLTYEELAAVAHRRNQAISLLFNKPVKAADMDVLGALADFFSVEIGDLFPKRRSG